MTINKVARDNDYDPVKEYGASYTIILWYDVGKTVDNYQVEVTGAKYEKFTNHDLRTVTIDVSETIGASGKVVIKVVPK